MLSVYDNGQGMSADVCSKATEPFFTTKGPDKGTGLGLSMVDGFVERSGGHMRIQSKPGNGTTIRLYLPRVFEDLDTIELSSPQSSLQHGHETILVVDDEKAIVDMVVSNLHELGYKTVVANNSKQALDILKTNNTIDLLFTDVIMPGKMDGYELALSAQRLYPSLKVLMSSGFTNRDNEIDDSDDVL